MRYDDVVAAMFGEPVAPPRFPSAVVAPSPARRLRDAAEPLAMHAVWSRATNEALAACGLDFLSGYVWGRAAALGEPAPGVVVAAFGAFAPDLVRATYEAGRAACPRPVLLATRGQATTASLREVLGPVDAEVAPVVDALRRAVAPVPTAGRPLFAGLLEQPAPADPVEGLWRTCEVLRELRGDTHVAACVSAGIDPVEMNVLTELWLGMPAGSYTATRGWAPEAIAAALGRLAARGLVEGEELTGAGRAARDDLEAVTDRGVQPVVDALGVELDGVVAALDGWAAACVAARAFPPDPHKRAAG